MDLAKLSVLIATASAGLHGSFRYGTVARVTESTPARVSKVYRQIKGFFLYHLLQGIYAARVFFSYQLMFLFHSLLACLRWMIVFIGNFPLTVKNFQ